MLTLSDFLKKNYNDYDNLIHILNKDDNWKIVVNYFRKKNFSFKIQNKCDNYGKLLIGKLSQGCIYKDDFKKILLELNLMEAVEILSDPEPLVIVEQPGEDQTKIEVQCGQRLRLVCKAMGIPLPKYQWYHDNMKIDSATSSELIVDNFRSISEGEYYCKVKHFDNAHKKFNCIESNSVIVETTKKPPEFIEDLPTEIIGVEGQDLILSVQIYCESEFNIEWLKQNTILEEKSCCLKLNKLNKISHQTTYQCIVKNCAGEIFSNICKVVIHVVNEATAKLAILIANENYINDKTNILNTPANDVALLSEILKNELNFQVIPFINLTLEEMKNALEWFRKIIPPGSYVLFYFVGHGFVKSNNKFMMPIDCPSSELMRMKHCLCEELVIKILSEAQLRFLVIILDMCLTAPDSNENKGIYQENVPHYDYDLRGCNTVFAYATSKFHPAYERPHNNLGIYMNHLKNYISLDNILIKNLDYAHTEFLKEETKKQKPTLYYDTNNKKLTDSVEENTDLIEVMKEINNLTINGLSVREVQVQYGSETEKAHIEIKPYKSYILNSLDIYFENLYSENLLVSAEVSEHVTCKWSSSDFKNLKIGDRLTLTVHNLQQFQDNLKVTFHLKNAQDENVGKFTLDFGLPLNFLYSVNSKL